MLKLICKKSTKAKRKDEPARIKNGSSILVMVSHKVLFIDVIQSGVDVIMKWCHMCYWLFLPEY